MPDSHCNVNGYALYQIAGLPLRLQDTRLEITNGCFSNLKQRHVGSQHYFDRLRIKTKLLGNSKGLSPLKNLRACIFMCRDTLTVIALQCYFSEYLVYKSVDPIK